jgi:hypothetical protein
MVVEISVFWIIAFIFLVHTILTHLFNWGIRENNDESLVALLITFKIVLFVVALLIIYNLLN